MGCSSSKAATPQTSSPPKRMKDDLYKLLVKCQTQTDLLKTYGKGVSEAQAIYTNPNSQSTALHMACRLVDQQETFTIINELISMNIDALKQKDADGLEPIHYIIAARSKPVKFERRYEALKRVIDANKTVAKSYFERNDVFFEKHTASPLYHALVDLPDDTSAPFFNYIQLIASYSKVQINESRDYDQPLALLYRRFTRQFDLSEKFFPGDNSLPEVVQHRQHYKKAASQTWKLMEILLTHSISSSAIGDTSLVHAAVQQACLPPDLLRYLVETHAHDLATPDGAGNLPLHYAAQRTYDPAPLTKYIMDELLYKFPEAASVQSQRDGKYALEFALQSDKPWIQGGTKSIYDAFPDAVEQLPDELKDKLQIFLLEDEEDEEGEKGNKDEQHDAIMVVQREEATVSDVVASMWAHEEDAGVQMLACVSLAKLPSQETALLGIPAVVNAMKAHPNEVIVQEKAASALHRMAPEDGAREVSLVASGAVAALVGAMQAHVNDEKVQEECCNALREIVLQGGADRATIVASVSGITAFCNALSAHSSSEKVQKAACGAFEALWRHPSSLPDCREHVEPLINAASERYPDSCAELVQRIVQNMQNAATL